MMCLKDEDKDEDATVRLLIATHWRLDVVRLSSIPF